MISISRTKEYRFSADQTKLFEGKPLSA